MPACAETSLQSALPLAAPRMFRLNFRPALHPRCPAGALLCSGTAPARRMCTKSPTCRSSTAPRMMGGRWWRWGLWVSCISAARCRCRRHSESNALRAGGDCAALRCCYCDAVQTWLQLQSWCRGALAHLRSPSRSSLCSLDGGPVLGHGGGGRRLPGPRTGGGCRAVLCWAALGCGCSLALTQCSGAAVGYVAAAFRKTVVQ